MRILILVAVVGFSSVARAQVDRSCVHEVDDKLRDRIGRLTNELPPNDDRRQEYRKLRGERERLSARAASAEADYASAMRPIMSAVAAQRPDLPPRSADFQRLVTNEAVKDPAVDRAYARMLQTQIFGYDDTEGRQHQLLKTLPIPRAEYENKVDRLMSSAPTPVARAGKDEVVRQLLVVVEASRRVGDGRPVDDWMMSRQSGVGFDTGGVADADELRGLMAAFRGREERQALDVAHLPSYVPPATVRRDWALSPSPRMPETRRQAAAAVARIVADDVPLRKVKQIFRNDPPPPEVTAPPDPPSFKKKAVEYIKTVVQEIKKVEEYVLD